ncbi:MAG: hypothetical protein H7338_04025 [Candidatus Sericytochromatia bacterium]|nr:hypothetical protein [Candidatus Sericytochromatia bacterium]
MTDALGRGPLTGDVYVFVGKDRRGAKVLYWDGPGITGWPNPVTTGPSEHVRSIWSMWKRGRPTSGPSCSPPPSAARLRIFRSSPLCRSQARECRRR